MSLLDVFARFDQALEWQVPEDDPRLEPEPPADLVARPADS